MEILRRAKERSSTIKNRQNPLGGISAETGISRRKILKDSLLFTAIPKRKHILARTTRGQIRRAWSAVCYSARLGGKMKNFSTKKEEQSKKEQTSSNGGSRVRRSVRARRFGWPDVTSATCIRVESSRTSHREEVVYRLERFSGHWTLLASRTPRPDLT